MQRRDHGESLFLLCKTSFSVHPPPPLVAPRKLVEMFEADPFSIRTGSPSPPFPSPSFPREEPEVGFRSGFSPGGGVGGELRWGLRAAPRLRPAGVPRGRGGRKAARGAEGCAGVPACLRGLRAGRGDDDDDDDTHTTRHTRLRRVLPAAGSRARAVLRAPVLGGHAWVSDKPRGEVRGGRWRGWRAPGLFGPPAWGRASNPPCSA